MKPAENEMLTRVGKGTPAGELLRRYWHPVCVAGELTDENPIKRVLILGEYLAVFRLPRKPGEQACRYGLVAERCSHRLASLAYGRVEETGIRCPYHGWLYGLDGTCLETPPEPADWAYKNEIKHIAYPVEKLGGLLWTYMGPPPAPLLPRWDCLAREDGKRRIDVESILDCNWLQPMENSVDPSHFYWLHGFRFGSGHLVDSKEKRDAQYNEQHEFIPFEYGIMKRRITPKGMDEHPLIFPCSLRLVTRVRGATPPQYRHSLQIRVPMDDTHTRIYRVNFVPSEIDHSPADGDPPFELRRLKLTEDDSRKARPMEFPMTKYDTAVISAQDSMAWETQGPVTDRAREHLGHADKGIVMFRRVLREQIEIVQRGGEPMGIIRDPVKNQLIDIPVVNERLALVRQG